MALHIGPTQPSAILSIWFVLANDVDDIFIVIELVILVTISAIFVVEIAIEWPFNLTTEIIVLPIQSRHDSWQIKDDGNVNETRPFHVDYRRKQLQQQMPSEWDALCSATNELFVYTSRIFIYALSFFVLSDFKREKKTKKCWLLFLGNIFKKKNGWLLRTRLPGAHWNAWSK